MATREDFIRKRIFQDIDTQKVNYVHTRFPPEPNGYLHIGHAKSIFLNFDLIYEIKQKYGAAFKAQCNLRFDDTNPEKESQKYIDAIKEDVKWLECDWGDNEYYASDYFQKLYEYAIIIIKKGLAYVDHSTPEEIRTMRGTPTVPGVASPYRNRSVEENLDLFEKMKNGSIAAGRCLLRAKIDMAHSNIVMRDPPMYRIRDVRHHRSGDAWRIYPMYDFAHALSDAIEGITHSLCTLEFEIHRELYDWFLDAVDIRDMRPVQIEFSRLNITHTVLSKRKMKFLVDKNYVDGWDDPRMPTISGCRRRGFTPDALRSFCQEIGITKTLSTMEYSRLEEAVRTDLNQHAHRVMAVFTPVKLIIDNYPEDKVEYFTAENNPLDKDSGTHTIPFSRELFIEYEDVKENPPKDYYRLAVGKEVRLKYAYYVTCTKIVKDEHDAIVEVHAHYDPQSRGGGTADNRKVKGTIHWVSAAHYVDITVDIFEPLFTTPFPEKEDFTTCINHNSLIENAQVKAEVFFKDLLSTYDNTRAPYPLQCMRKGYIIYDEKKAKKRNKPVFNYTVTLKEGWKL